MRELGREEGAEARIYLTGGATAVLFGWRLSTIDVDLKMEPESDQLFRAFPRLKEQLEINIELASPDHFIPALPDWRERSRFIAREGPISFYHFDLYSQALAKVQRGHAQDRLDVQQMVERGLLDRDELLRHFEQIEPSLYRFPAIDPVAFRRAVEKVVRT